MLRSLQSVVLSLLLATMPAWATPDGDQTAGEVKRMVPDASRNAKPLAVKDSLQWNDLLKTDAKGRVLAGLTDGSILTVGSNTELKVVQHDAKSQQTAIEMNYGKVRNQVVKITQPGGKYEVKTPNTVIGVIGTDFYVGYENNQTTVICFEGRVLVTPTVGAAVTLSTGQMTTVDARTETTGPQVTTAPPAVMQASIIDTSVPEGQKKQALSNRTKIIVGGVMLVVAGLTFGLTQANSSSKPCGCK